MEDRRHHSGGGGGEPPSGSRIFVGNLDASVTMEDLKGTFKRYGRISEVVMRKNFAFVQFDSPDQAQSAIEKENGQSIKNSKMSISLAKARTFKNDRREEGPHHGEGKRARMDFPSRKRQSSGGGGVPTRWGERRMEHQVPPFHDRHARGQMDHHFEGGGSGGGTGRDEELPFRDPGPSSSTSYRHHEEHPRRHDIPPFESSSSNHQDRHHHPPFRVNDIEIVCSNRSVTDYAETIEMRLKDMGFSVDVLYPNPDFPLSRILESITSRGVSFAMLLTPMSMDHRSVTLNVLQGVQQEHRNMSLEDALYLLSNERRQGSRSMSSNNAFEENPPRRGASNRHPRDIVDILELLLQCRPLSISQYDDMIHYLGKCRDESLRSEHDGPSNVLASSSSTLRESGRNHYDKILNILTNKGVEEGQSKHRHNSHQSGEPPQETAAAINPSLQKAIDSLIKTGPNLLNQIKKLEVPHQRLNNETNNGSGGSCNNVLSNYYSSLFKGDGVNHAQSGGARPPPSSGGGDPHYHSRPSGSHGNSLFSAYGN